MRYKAIMSSLSLLCLSFIVLSTLICGLNGETFTHGQKVILYVNKVGPYFNPHETYHYYQLPVCRPTEVHTKRLSLGEVLDGDRMAESMYELKFGEDTPETKLCTVPLKTKDIGVLSEAIEDLYYFEFILDQIPIRGFVGQLEEQGFVPHTHKVYLLTHHHFTIEYNGNQIIYANVSTKNHTPLSLNDIAGNLDVTFTYSVKWVKTSMEYKDRAKRISSTSFFPKSLEIHWLSIINSLVLVVLLVGFVAIILTRILRSDFARYNPDEMDDMEDLEVDDGGWKIIHTDVFRFPPYSMLFCAILGCGSQFLAIATGIVLMALLGMFNVHRHGAINTAAVLLYAFTSCIAGFVAARMYKQMGGEKWVININLTSLLFAGPFFIIWAIVNSVAWAHGSTQALPWTTVVLLMSLWLLVGYPLTVIGGIFGKNYAHGFDAPCRTKNIPREIPSLPLYKQPHVMSLIGGFLPFSAISVELYYIVSTLWGREQYTLYGVLFLVFAILIVVTAAISVALTYFQLSAEDYRWWWRSIFSGGSTGLFVLCYALFYFFKRSQMSGDLQTLQFFGYMLLACYIFFLMLGTVSFFSSLKFIRYIYVNIKMD